MSWRGSMFLRGSLRCSGVSRVPMRCLTCSRSIPSKQLLWPAFQLFWLSLTWSMIDWKSRKRRSFLATAERASRHSTKTVIVFIKEINYQSYKKATEYTLLPVHLSFLPYYLFMRSVKLHYSSRKQNTKMPVSHQAPLRLPDTLQQSLPNAQSCRSQAVQLPPTLRQAPPREHSQAESIKAAIHKLRTETPRFSQLGFMHGRSRSYFFERTPKVRKSQERVLQMLTNMRNLQKKETKYFLPGKAVWEQRPSQNHSLPRAQPQQDCNVILLKRNMRYRLQKLPNFDKPLPTSDPQMNMSVTGWHRNPEEREEFPQRL